MKTETVLLFLAILGMLLVSSVTLAKVEHLNECVSAQYEQFVRHVATDGPNGVAKTGVVIRECN